MEELNRELQRRMDELNASAYPILKSLDSIIASSQLPRNQGGLLARLLEEAGLPARLKE